MGTAGTNTDALAFGGGATATAVTEEWNGSSWTEIADLSTARQQLGSAGTTAAALAFGGNPPATGLAITEEWSNQTFITRTVSTD